MWCCKMLNYVANLQSEICIIKSSRFPHHPRGYCRWRVEVSFYVDLSPKALFLPPTYHHCLVVIAVVVVVAVVGYCVMLPLSVRLL